MPRRKKPPAASGQAELARLMAQIQLCDDHALEVEAPAPRYTPPPLPTAQGAALASSMEASSPSGESDAIVEMSVPSPPSPMTCTPTSEEPTPEPHEPATLADLPEPHEPATLADLPDDLLGWIFAFVHIEQLCRSARPVCHGWRDLVAVVIDTYSTLLTSEQNQQHEPELLLAEPSPLPQAGLSQGLPGGGLLLLPLEEEDISEDITLHGLLWAMSPRASQASSSPGPFAPAAPLRTPLRHRSFHRRSLAANPSNHPEA